MENKRWLTGLDFVRAAACIAILSFHMNITLLGKFAVTVFFALSGFLMTYNTLASAQDDRLSLRGCVLFGIHRIGKLYHAYLLSMAVPALMFLYGIYSGTVNFDTKLITCFVTNILLVQSLSPDAGIYFFLNGVAWYLSTSMFLYMAFPYIIAHIRKYKNTRQAWYYIAAAFLAQILAIYLVHTYVRGISLLSGSYISGNDFFDWFAYISPFSRIFDFIIGCNLAYIFRNRRKTELAPAAAGLLECTAIAFTVLTQVAFEKGMLPEISLHGTAFIPASALLIWAFARGDGFVSRLMDNPVVHYISGLSSYIFIFHFTVIKLMTPIINRIPLPFRALQFVYLFTIPTLTFIVSALYRKLERKVRQKT